MQNKIVIKGIFCILLLMLCALPITTKTAIEDEIKEAIITAEEDKIEEAILETAATEEEIEGAIEAGISWLAEQQCDDGGWLCHWNQDRVSPTGFIVLKMEDRAIELGYDTPFDPNYEYSENVTSGLNFIFSFAHQLGTDMIYFVYPEGSGNYYSHLNYETSMAMMAIAASNTPDRRVDVSGSAVDGFTYAEVMQNATNYLISSQNAESGGWGYSHWRKYADNSNTGYVVLALTYAETRFGLDIDQDVKDKLSEYIDYIQNDVDGDDDDGGSGYSIPGHWVNILKTGNLLFEMAFVGDTSDSDRAQAAIKYIEEHWFETDPFLGWNYQSAYTTMKGFEAMGIETVSVGGKEIDWFDNFSTTLVNGQQTDGSWPAGMWPLPPLATPVLSTVWALLTLERVVEIPEIPAYVDIKPGSWPNPINVESKGVFAVAICGTENFDVSMIDLASVQVYKEPIEEGVSPLRWSYEDVATPFEGDEGEGHALNGDEITDLVLHFETQEIIEALGLTDFAGQTIPLVIEGNLKEEAGGTPIQGQDYVWILEKVFKPFIIDDAGGGDYTWEEASKQPWCNGKGTSKHPYVIKNIAINASGSTYGISIYNSIVHFEIKKCLITGIDVPDPSAALVLVNVRNALISKNTFYGNGVPDVLSSGGIALFNSNDNIIAGNYVSENTGFGIYLENSDNNILSDNDCIDNMWGIFLTGSIIADPTRSSDENMILQNDCMENNIGILLWEGASNNLISDNICMENTEFGIVVGVNSNGNIISENNCSMNSGSGIALVNNVDENDVTENDCSQNGAVGIYLNNSANGNKISYNTITENYYGVVIDWDNIFPTCYYNEIHHNIIINNVENRIDAGIGTYWHDNTPLP